MGHFKDISPFLPSFPFSIPSLNTVRPSQRKDALRIPVPEPPPHNTLFARVALGVGQNYIQLFFTPFCPRACVGQKETV
jgi:hypothetical protein